MGKSGEAYVEHVALHVENVDWYLKFFHDTMGLTERMRKDTDPIQVWLYGGIQLIGDGAKKNDQSQLAHLGIMVENQTKVLEKIYAYDVEELPQGHNWVKLPDGLQLEILQAAPKSVEEALNIVPWN